jgi:hypothetical protein
MPRSEGYLDWFLPPGTQLAFFYDRLRGRFRYGGHRLYTVKSLQRLGPYLAIPLLVVALGLYEGERRSAEQVQNSADDILNGLEFQQLTHGITESEAEALLRLASAEEPVRQLVLTQVLTNSDRARVFLREPEVVIRAIIGVSPRFRALASASLASATASSASNRPEISRATISVARFLGRTAVVPLSWWVAAIEGTTDLDALKALCSWPEALPAKLSDSQAKDAVESFLAVIKRTTNRSAQEMLGAGLRALDVKLTDSQAKDAVEPFLAAIKSTPNPDALKALGEGLRTLPAKLTDAILPGEPEHPPAVAVLRLALRRSLGSGNSLTARVAGSTRATAFCPPSATQSAPSGPTITPWGAASGPSTIRSDFRS